MELCRGNNVGEVNVGNDVVWNMVFFIWCSKYGGGFGYYVVWWGIVVVSGCYGVIWWFCVVVY